MTLGEIEIDDSLPRFIESAAEEMKQRGFAILPESATNILTDVLLRALHLNLDSEGRGALREFLLPMMISSLAKWHN